MDWGALLTAAIPGLIQAGSSAVGNLYKPDYEQQKLDQNAQQYSQTQAFNEKELAQRLAIAQINASAGNAGAGAAVAAARIKAATDTKAIHQQALAALLQGRLDQAKLADPKEVNNAGQAVAGEARQTGQTGLAAFNALVQSLQNPLLRGR